MLTLILLQEHGVSEVNWKAFLEKYAVKIILITREATLQKLADQSVCFQKRYACEDFSEDYLKIIVAKIIQESIEIGIQKDQLGLITREQEKSQCCAKLNEHFGLANKAKYNQLLQDLAALDTQRPVHIESAPELIPSHIATPYQDKVWLKPYIHYQPVYNLLSLQLSDIATSSLKMKLQSAFKQADLLANCFEIKNEKLMYQDAFEQDFAIEYITEEALTNFLKTHFIINDDKLLRVFFIANRKMLILAVHPILIHTEALYYLGRSILDNVPFDNESVKPRANASYLKKDFADLTVLFKHLSKKSYSNRFSTKNSIELSNNNLDSHSILAALLIFLHKYCNSKKVTLIVKVLTGKETTCHLLNIDFSNLHSFKDVEVTIKDSLLSKANTITPLEFGNYSPELANLLGLLPVLTILPPEWQDLGLEQSHGSHPILFEYNPSCKLLNIQFNTNFFTTLTNQFLESIEYYFKNSTLSPSIVDAEILSLKMKQDILKISTNFSNTTPQTIYDTIFLNPAFQSGRTAVAINQENLSYGELQEKVNAFCQLLLGQSLKANSVIAVYMDRSIEMIVTLISIWRLGYVYLPITKNCPSHLLQYMVKNANAEIIVTNLELSLENSVKVIDWKTLNLSANPIVLKPLVFPKNLAYIIYTSGTTGLPKGVKVNHKSICDQVEWMKFYFAITTNDKILHKTPIGFDVSLWELLLPLISNAQLILLQPGKDSDPEAIVEAIIKLGITVIHFVPPVLEIVLEYIKDNRIPKEALHSLRHVICSGSALPEKLRTDFQQLMPHSAKLSNLYGPTEGVIDHTSHTFESNEEGEVPIGKPIPGKSAYILDDNQKLVPEGVVGEIVLGGTLADGYIGNIPGEKKFIPSPFANETMLYRTGDLGVIIEQKIYYRGRNDRQVKPNGIRIELDGIENIIKNSRLCINCAVVAKKNANGEVSSLVAYIQGETNLEDLKKFVANNLAHIAGNIIFIKKEKLPLNINHKIAYKDLERDAETLSLNSTQFKMPQCYTQYTLVKIWQEVLTIASQISVTANFFEMGGNSLLAIQLLGRIKRRFDKTISVIDFLQAPTIHGLSALLGGNFADSPTTPVFPLKIKAGLPLSFWIHPVGGLGFPYALLSDHLKQYSTYAISDPYFSNSDFSFSSISQMAEYYVAAIRKIQPVGPYVLGGVSFGGMVALEMARILENARCEVKAVIMIDTYNMAKADITILNNYEQLQVPRIIEFLKSDGVNPDSLEGKSMIKEVRTNVFLQKNHQPQPFYGKVVLIKAQIADQGGNFGFAKDPVNGWTKTLCPYLAIRSVKAMHKNIISMENIVAVSDLINDELAKLDCTSLHKYFNEAICHLDRAKEKNDIFLIDLLNSAKNHEQVIDTKTNRSKEMRVIVIVQQFGANKIDWVKVKREHNCLLYAVINNGTKQVLEENSSDKCFEKIYAEEQFTYEKILLHIQDVMSRHDKNDIRIVSTDEQAILMCSKIRDNLKIPGPSLEECLPFRDKIIMKQTIIGKVAEHLPRHITFDPVKFQQDQKKYLTEIISYIGFPAFIKPIDGDGSRDVRKIDSQEELVEHCQKIINSNVKFEIDQFITGELYHCDSMVKNGQIILSLVSKYLYPVADFLKGKACTSALLDKKDPSYQRFTEFNKKILSAFPKVPDGVTHLEFIVTPEDKLYFIEVAARSPGALFPEAVEMTVGFNLREIHCLLQGGLDVSPVVKETGKYATWVYFPKQVGKVVELVPPTHFTSEYKIVSKMNMDIEVKNPPNSLLDFAYTMIFSNQSRELLMKDFESLREFNPLRVFRKQPSNSNLTLPYSVANPNSEKREQKEDKEERKVPTP